MSLALNVYKTLPGNFTKLGIPNKLSSEQADIS